MANGQSHIYVECLNLKLSVVKRQGTSSHPDHFFSQQSNPGWNVSGTAIHVRVARNLPIKAAAFYPEAGWTQWKALNITDMPFHVSEAVAWHISKLKKCIFDDNWSGACILNYIIYLIIMIIWKIHYPRAGKIPTIPSGMLEEIISTTTRIHKYHNSQCNPARNHNLYLNSITKNAKVQMLIC